MRPYLRQLHKTLSFYGIDLIKFSRSIRRNKTDWFEIDLAELKKQKGDDKTFKMGPMYPILSERSEEAGVMKGPYFHQDLYVARQIFLANPQKHLDIGSRTDGFVAHVASFRNIELIDIRDIQSKVKNITFRQSDLMQLPSDLINSYDSISSLHAIEHFGLGRYGDKIDYWGYLKAIDNITKMLVQGGTFYFSVPIGPQRIEFNAHRVFAIQYLLDLLSPNFTIIKFSFVDDAGDLHEDVELTKEGISSSFGCQYGCGIFILSKK